MRTSDLNLFLIKFYCHNLLSFLMNCFAFCNCFTIFIIQNDVMKIVKTRLKCVIMSKNDLTKLKVNKIKSKLRILSIII
jgi:hypothetical protein